MQKGAQPKSADRGLCENLNVVFSPDGNTLALCNYK